MERVRNGMRKPRFIQRRESFRVKNHQITLLQCTIENIRHQNAIVLRFTLRIGNKRHLGAVMIKLRVTPRPAQRIVAQIPLHQGLSRLLVGRPSVQNAVLFATIVLIDSGEFEMIRERVLPHALHIFERGRSHVILLESDVEAIEIVVVWLGQISVMRRVDHVLQLHVVSHIFKPVAYEIHHQLVAVFVSVGMM